MANRRSFVKSESETRGAPTVDGHVIHLGEGRSIAVYVRDGRFWVADFRDGRGELMDGGSWFRFHAGGLQYCHNRRTALQSSTPLNADMVAKIERLHRESDARQAWMLTAPRTLAAAVQRGWAGLTSRMRGLAVAVRADRL
jgi:hypothetical protein